MPIVMLSSSDPVMLKEGQETSQHYKEKLLRLVPDFFKNNEEKEMRVTFTGHANTQSYGEEALTAYAFYRKLNELGFPFAEVKQIDLDGCGIGLRKNGAPNYLTEFAKELYRYPENRHIILKSFTDLVLPNDVKLEAMFVQTTTTQTERSITLRGIAGKAEFATYTAEMAARTDFSHASMAKCVMKHSQAFVTHSVGIREALDSNENYSLNYEIFTKQQEFSKYRLECWAEINNQIADLKLKQNVALSEANQTALAQLMQAKLQVEDTDYDLLEIVTDLPSLFNESGKAKIITITNILIANQNALNQIKHIVPDHNQLLEDIKAETLFKIFDDLINPAIFMPYRRNIIEIAEAILQSQYPNNDPIELSSILCKVAFRGDTDLTQLLLEYGANPDFTNTEGETPLTLAAKQGNSDVVSTLLTSEIINPDQANAAGWTPLALAIKSGYSDVVRDLLATNKVNINQVVNSEGWTPFSIAMTYEQYYIRQMLESYQEGFAPTVTEVKIHIEEKPNVSPDKDTNDLSAQKYSMFPPALASVESKTDFDSPETRKKLQELISSLQSALKNYQGQRSFLDSFRSTKKTMAEDARNKLEIFKKEAGDGDTKKVFEQCKNLVSILAASNLAYDNAGGKFASFIELLNLKIQIYENSNKFTRKPSS